MNGSERGLVRRAIASAALVAATLAAGAASAGTVTVNKPNVTRPTPDGGVILQRPDTSLFYISYQDCIDNIEFEFPVAVSSPTGFQVWASATADCKSGSTRTMAGSDCVQLASSYPTGTGKVLIKARDLARKVFDDIDASCNDTSGSTSPRPLNIYFMLNADNGDVSGTDVYTWQNTQVDLLGPAAPADITLGLGDGELILNLPTNTDADTKGYLIYYYELGTDDAGATTSSSSGAAGAGGSTTASSSSSTSGVAGAGGSTTASSSSSSSSSSGIGGAGGTGGVAGAGGSTAGSFTPCATGITIPGVDSAHPSLYSEHRLNVLIDSTARSPNVTGLTNGAEYAIGIAAYDEVDNIGPLSTLLCGAPQPTKTFYGEYCADGGGSCNGGCGACAVGTDADLAWPGLAAAAVAGLGLAVRRERRRRAEKRGAA